jgi:phenylalanyl-tRNA synthetase beta chain
VKVPVSWLREFADPPVDAAAIGARLAACGFEVASIRAGVIDFEITANRPDCLSVYGLAREAATVFGVELRPFDGTSQASRRPEAPHAVPAVPVRIDDPACGRYALALADVTVGPSPGWLADRLTAAGVRPINTIVDVSNYVMLEMGHPTHAFDAATLAGSAIHVRHAHAGEKIATLDGQTRALDGRMLVIADRDRAVAIAGVMGGAATEVSAKTSRIAIESAWFQPPSVRLTSRRLGLKTEASARFERGADIEAPIRALERALALLQQIGAGTADGPILDVYPHPARRRHVLLRPASVERLLGDRVPASDIERILTKLGFVLAPLAHGWEVLVPSFRVDVALEADLIEEIGRHWGFDRIPATFPELRAMPPVHDASVMRDRRVRRVLSGAGLHEAVTFTFIEQAAGAPFAGTGHAAVPIANPLSEKFAVLRPSLLPGLVDSLVYNRRREIANVRLFEIGSTFGPAGERQTVGWVMTGERDGHWSAPATPVDFFDAKGVAELVALTLGASVSAEESTSVGWLVAGGAAELVAQSGDQRVAVGMIGQIRPDLAAARGLAASEALYGGEIDLAALAACGSNTIEPIAPLPRYPSVTRDLAIVVDERLPAASVRGTIHSSAPATLVAVREFDRYQGKGVPSGQVSLAVRLTFRAADRTLTDAEVQTAVDAIVSALTREHRAALRGTTGPE